MPLFTALFRPSGPICLIFSCAWAPAQASEIEYVFNWVSDVKVTSENLYEDVPFELVVLGDASSVTTGTLPLSQTFTRNGGGGSGVFLPATWSAIGGQSELLPLTGELAETAVYLRNLDGGADIRLFDYVGSEFTPISLYAESPSGLDGYDLQSALDPVIFDFPSSRSSFTYEFDKTVAGTNQTTIFDVIGIADPTFSAVEVGGSDLNYIFNWVSDVTVTSETLYEDVPFELVVLGDSASVTTGTLPLSQTFTRNGGGGSGVFLPATWSAIGGQTELLPLTGELAETAVYLRNLDGGATISLFDYTGSEFTPISLYVESPSGLDGYDLQSALDPVIFDFPSSRSSFTYEFDKTVAGTNQTTIFDVIGVADPTFSANVSPTVSVPAVFPLLFAGLLALVANRSIKGKLHA